MFGCAKHAFGRPLRKATADPQVRPSYAPGELGQPHERVLLVVHYRQGLSLPVMRSASEADGEGQGDHGRAPAEYLRLVAAGLQRGTGFTRAQV